MSRLDESRWKKHGERYATAITDDRGNASRLRSSMRNREQLLFASRVDIDVYDASGNIVHIAASNMNYGQTYKKYDILRMIIKNAWAQALQAVVIMGSFKSKLNGTNNEKKN
ncbi:hypothetical protein AVEN_210807-1 [Araneus ventricosus]|uniref:Uncharacterized protein n=1 Tax=Araneus ventricosus TaxID=182803 RepID=A0A4Y2CN26_ARAVE|nr:hypothetical protein AVEN_210807-1 [Araneus ventricosus]